MVLFSEFCIGKNLWMEMSNKYWALDEQSNFSGYVVSGNQKDVNPSSILIEKIIFFHLVFNFEGFEMDADRFVRNSRNINFYRFILKIL